MVQTPGIAPWSYRHQSKPSPILHSSINCNKYRRKHIHTHTHTHTQHSSEGAVELMNGVYLQWNAPCMRMNESAGISETQTSDDLQHKEPAWDDYVGGGYQVTKWSSDQVIKWSSDLRVLHVSEATGAALTVRPWEHGAWQRERKPRTMNVMQPAAEYKRAWVKVHRNLRMYQK